MTGIPGLRCPECGRGQRREKGLLRTRRRWRWAAIGALLVIAGVAVYATPGARARGLAGVTPGWLLVMVAPAADPVWMTAGATPRSQAFLAAQAVAAGRWATPGAAPTLEERLTIEAWKRLNDGELADWQGSVFLRRYFGADPGAAVSERIAAPPRWARGHAAPVSVGRGVLPARLTGRIGGGPWTPMGGTTRIPIGESAPARAGVEFRFGAMGTAYRTPALMEVRALDDLLDRLDSPEWNGRVAAALRPRLAAYGDALLVEYDDGTPGAEPLGFDLCFAVELRSLGRTAARSRGATVRAGPYRQRMHVWLVPEPGGPILLEDLAGRAELVVRGDPGAAARRYLQHYSEGREPVCWSGEVTIPVGEVPQNRRSDPAAAPRGEGSGP